MSKTQNFTGLLDLVGLVTILLDYNILASYEQETCFVMACCLVIFSMGSQNGNSMLSSFVTLVISWLFIMQLTAVIFIPNECKFCLMEFTVV
jgi:hypothetical protein